MKELSIKQAVIILAVWICVLGGAGYMVTHAAAKPPVTKHAKHVVRLHPATVPYEQSNARADAISGFRAGDPMNSNITPFPWGMIPDPAQAIAYSPMQVNSTNNPDGTATITRKVSRAISYPTVIQVITYNETDYGQGGMAFSWTETSYVQ